MEHLKKYKLENNTYILTLEDSETGETRSVIVNKNSMITIDGFKYIILDSTNELFIYRYNIYCDPEDNIEKPLFEDLPSNLYEIVKNMYISLNNTINNGNNFEEKEELTNEENEELPNDISDTKKRRKWVKIFLEILFFIILSIFLFYLGKSSSAVKGEASLPNSSNDIYNNTLVNSKPKSEFANTTKYIETIKDIDVSNSKVYEENLIVGYDVSGIVEEVLPSIVAIINVRTSSYYSDEAGFFDDKSEGDGSGIIIGKNDTELLIATNEHVVTNNSELLVYFLDDYEKDGIIAQVKGTDVSNDLAVISVNLADIDDEILANIKIASIGDSDSLRLGEPVIVIGNALGHGQSVTTGVVSGINKVIENKGPFIQTDAAMNPGNSGGALINAKGEVVGINSMKSISTSIEGMGFSIPSSTFVPIIDKLSTLITRQKVEINQRGYLGILGTNMTANISIVYDIPVGVYITSIIEGEAAEKSNLQERDIIVKANNREITEMAELQDELSYFKAGEEITLTIKRLVDNKYTDIVATVVLGQKTT